MSDELEVTFTSHNPNANSFLNISLMVARQYLAEDDDRRIFLEWMVINVGDLENATKALGIEIKEGPYFAKRLEDEVTKKLQYERLMVEIDVSE